MFYQHFCIKSFRKHQSAICVNFTELRQIVCKLYKLSTNFLTVPCMRKDTLEFAKEKYFSGHSDTRSVQVNFDLLTSFIQDSADKHIPLKTSRSVSSIPWITPEIRKKIRRKK